ncbi:hypothetical protein E4V42_21925 [Clostridium estertheticum]|uniref:DUF4297 domain-containing protein n=1 Tax=Clostridium estertheticum TaxID=238834 RepID=A0A5N7J7Z1_9CLOT|nr:hypothetical protein [Clostridium estertheticum]MPQ34056.1 hypothetical protein [Clostridium estertheticum]MPQ64856.1 hypothetical protein [Clostridium estertheticum]
MSRSADYTIQGFIYQFNKYLLEILRSSDEAYLTIEGINEDVEVEFNNETEAIQCKYHEGIDNFNWSIVYRPILQMMNHYYDNGNDFKNVKYRIYAYFPNKEPGTVEKLASETITDIFNSTNVKLATLINKLKDKLNMSAFQDVFCIEFGKSLDKLRDETYNLLEQNSIPKEDIDTLIYPNAIQKVAELSIQHDVQNRKVNKYIFLTELKLIRKTAVTQWTMALKNYKKILETRKKQLKSNLSKNYRTRYFIISSTIEEFDSCIVNFIKDYVDKYNFKTLHTNTPLFCLDCPNDLYENIKKRLYKKDIIFTDGYVTTNVYDEKRLLRLPMINFDCGKVKEREFSIRLINKDNIDVVNKSKCDDLFIISNNDFPMIDSEDVEIEKVELNKIQEIKYIMGMSDTYE